MLCENFSRSQNPAVNTMTQPKNVGLVEIHANIKTGVTI